MLTFFKSLAPDCMFRNKKIESVNIKNKRELKNLN